MTIEAESQQLEKDNFVELFSLDLGPLGESIVFYFTTNLNPDGSKLAFNGIEYDPLDFTATGFETSVSGTFPRPVITFPNAGNLVTSLINSYGDLTGAIFTRIRTYKKYLDGESEGGQGIQYSPDIFFVEQRTKLNPSEGVWRLSSSLDFSGVQLPRRLALRDTCSRTYRRWDATAGAFTYGSCPYTGSAYFDRNDNPTSNPALDRCSRKLQGCEARFGENAELPTYAFPALARVRV